VNITAQAFMSGGSLINTRRLRMLLGAVALTVACSANALASVRHVHLPYPNGNIDLYTTTGQCVLVVDGLVDDGAVKAFNEGLRQVQRLRCAERIVVLNSAGGAPRFAYSVADFLGKHEFDTEIVDGSICFSACSYIFLGGRKRVVGDRGKFGVHQHSREGVCALAFSDGEEKRMRAIMEKALPAPAMNRLIGIILGTDCNTMNLLSREDLGTMSIANAQESRLDKDIRQAIAAREAQVFEQFRSAARGPWTRLAGDKMLTAFTRERAEPTSGANPTLWAMISYSADKAEIMSAEVYRSHEMLNEIDCDKQTISVIRGVYTREPMGAGPVVWKTGRLSSVPVKPRSIAEVFYKEACGRPLPR
jgi:hypothetical protein